MRPEDVVGTLDQQTSEISVPGLGDAELLDPGHQTGCVSGRTPVEIRSRKIRRLSVVHLRTAFNSLYS